MLNEKICKAFNGIPVVYKYRKSLKDSNNLIVILSGFSKSGYDFEGKSLEFVRSHILWIKDDYKGVVSYYFGSVQKLEFEQAIVSFVRLFAQDLGIPWNKIILLGASKGGASSLYLGIKYDFKTIIASVPQFKI